MKINLIICLKLQVYNEYINASYDLKVGNMEDNNSLENKLKMHKIHKKV